MRVQQKREVLGIKMALQMWSILSLLVYGILFKAKQKHNSSFHSQWRSFVKVLHSKQHLIREQGV